MLSNQLNDFKKLSAFHFNEARALIQNALGFVLAAQGKYPCAVRHYRAALMAKPDDPVALNNLAFALAKQLKSEEARTASLAFDFGLHKSHLAYQKFIILGKGRSGSNFLRGLLNSHHKIIVFGELFRNKDSIGWEFPDYEKYLQSPHLISLIQSDPINFLVKQVFRKYSPQISAVGFKLFYYHAQDDSRKFLWSYLKEQKNLKIIHIQRNNTLKELLSLRKAFKTNTWTNTDGIEEEKFSITLDYEDCIREFTYSHQIKAKYNAFFQDHPLLNIYYENLSNDYETEINKVQEFLGVSYEAVKPLTYKQAQQSPKEAISNYFELKEKFAGTYWEGFFED